MQKFMLLVMQSKLGLELNKTAYVLYRYVDCLFPPYHSVNIRKSPGPRPFNKPDVKH